MVSFTEAQILAWVSAWIWPFFRILGLFTTAPVLSCLLYTSPSPRDS